MQNEVISARVAQLRHWMEQHNVQAFIVPSTDAHMSEYVPSHWASRAWISGFDGSAGTAVVTLRDAALWTDSRYFLAAAQQLQDTPFSLMKDGVDGTPGIAEWLSKHLSDGDTVGLDGNVFPATAAEALERDLNAKGIFLNDEGDPFAEIWPNRPALPLSPVTIQPLKYTGETVAKKLERLRTQLRKIGAEAMLVSALDEVAWLLNLRGQDVECNPVFVAYCLLRGNETTLYVNAVKLPQKVRDHLTQQGVFIMPYEQAEQDLSALRDVCLLLPEGTSARMTAAAERCFLLRRPSPIASMKAIKTEAEIEGFKRAMLRDGVAMVKFLHWLLPAVKAGGVTEMDVAARLQTLRAEQELYQGDSFATIAAYADHGAIVHYEATPKTNRELKPKGLLLVDSGAQYLDGTTDITRTIALGEPTAEECHIYTLVLKGHIALSQLKFPDGVSGTQLDLAARQSMWTEGMNYGHGTGHGVGSFLNVHEGPHQIRMNYVPAPLHNGMTVTDEPGIYLPGRFGVRIENVLLTIPYKDTEFGHFLGFKPLTLCPIDLHPIEKNLLTASERAWLNDYHLEVCRQLMPLLHDETDRLWLMQATQHI